MKKLLVAILLVLTSFSAAFADAVDPLFGDTIDRNAEDFVLVSLCVADPTDWRDDVLGVSGHAFLRLQCPTFNLDFCFSYEGENVNDNMFRYLSGDTKMGMFAVPTDEYLQDYNRWNRSVHEYRLNLPPQVEQRLWEIMDNHLTGKILLRQDLNKYGCAITVVKYVKKALNGKPIAYAPDSELERMTRREIGYRSLEAHPWMRLFSMLLTDNRYNDNCPLDEKLIVPSDLAEVWQKATLDDKPFAVYLGDLVEGAELTNNKTWLTPMLMALILLLLTICFALTRYQFWDWILLALQTFGGILLIAFLIVSVVSGSSIYILLVLLNPLPAMLWYWRKYWGILYSAVLLLGTIVLACQPHMLIDPAMLVLALAYVILYAKPFVKAMIEKRK